MFYILLVIVMQEALEYCMHAGLWGHAMLLASKMDKKVHNDVTTRYEVLFVKTVCIIIPISCPIAWWGETNNDDDDDP